MDREQKIRENLGLVHACAKRFKARGMEYDDLYQAGCLGLVKAVDGFDESRGLKFSTYAVPVILGEMRRLFRDGGAIKVGRALKELSLKAGKATADFSAREGRTPTIQELAEILGVEAAEAAQAVNAGQRPISLTAGEEEGGQIDVAVDGEDDRITELLSLKQVVGELEPRDREHYCVPVFPEPHADADGRGAGDDTGTGVPAGKGDFVQAAGKTDRRIKPAGRDSLRQAFFLFILRESPSESLRSNGVCWYT